MHGRQGHVAYPHIADNPIRALAPVLSALHAPPLDAGGADFEPSNLEVVSVDVGNPAANVIPGEVRLVFNIRFNDAWTPETLSAEIARRVEAAAGGARFTLTFDPTNAVAFLTKRGPFTDLVAAAVEDVTGVGPALSTSGGTSDARFIKTICPVVELGLVERDHPCASTSGSRSTTSRGSSASTRACSSAISRRPSRSRSAPDKGRPAGRPGRSGCGRRPPAPP